MKLHSKIVGEGKPFLILHGFLGMGDNWKTLGNAFSEKGYQIHLIDQRNHGRSPHSEDFTFEDMAKDIREYCLENQLENIILLGHSMGGKTAMFTACDYPDLVDKLIVADISPRYYEPHHHTILEGLNYLNSREPDSRKDADKMLSEFVKEQAVRQFLLKNLYWKEKGKLGLRMNLKTLTEKLENISAPLPEGKRFSKETLFIKGEKSTYVPETDTELIKKHFPTAQIEVVKNAGHWLHAENREVFFEGVMRFLL